MGIARGVHLNKSVEEIGAGDQGHMFGYATDETEEMMPLTHLVATRLGERLTQVRKEGICKWVRPDGKTQVVVAYKCINGAMVPQYIHTIVISTQHDDGVSNDTIRKDLMEHVIKPTVDEKYLTDKTIYHLNPSGRFVIGDHMVMLGSQVEKLLLIPMVDGVPTVVVLFLVKIQLKWIDLLLIMHVGLQNLLLQLSCAKELLYNLDMLLE